MTHTHVASIFAADDLPDGAYSVSEWAGGLPLGHRPQPLQRLGHLVDPHGEPRITFGLRRRRGGTRGSGSQKQDEGSGEVRRPRT